MPDFLSGGGEMGALMRGHDWSTSSLGFPDNWPQPLRTTVRLTLSNGHPMYIWWGEDNACLYNDAYRKLIGSERHPGSLGRPAREVWSEIWNIIGPQIEQARAGRSAALHENALVPITRHGKREDACWTHSYSPIHDETAPYGVGGVLVVCVETTQPALAEQHIKAEIERQRNLFQAAPGFIAVLTGPRHVFEFVNNAYMHLVGDRDLIGKPVREAVPEIEGQGFFELLDKLYASGERFVAQQTPIRLQRKPGAPAEERFLDFVYQPITDPNGKVSGIFVEGFDVTERKNAEKALHELNASLEAQIAERSERLRASETLIRTFFDHSSECHAVMVEDEEGRFRYDEINPATLRLYGKTRDDVIGYTTEEVLGAENASKVDALLAACLRAGAPIRYERRQGAGVVEAVATPVPQEAGRRRRLVVSAYDVTERRRLEDQLRQAQKMEAVGQLTGGVAHDFNNLLTLVLGGLDLIGRQIPHLPASAAAEKIARARDMAMHGVQRAAALTSRLLAFSRQQPLAPQAVDANKLVTVVSDLLRRSLGESVSLETVLGGGLWRTFADPNQLESALVNLALNARDAMPNGGKLTIETANASLDDAYVDALTEPVAPGQYVMIAVADTGAGMDQATLERAFDPFFTTKEVGKGTGLGLSQVYGFARQSAGHVRIYSEIGEGTTVKIYLPRHVGQADERAIESAPEAARAVGLQSVLLVEDEEALRSYTGEILRELGYLVYEAANGAAALEILDRDVKIDLLLTDVVMPGGLNGRQLAERAAVRRPGLRVLFMTGYTRNAIVHHGRLDAGVHLISKPFSFREMAAKVRARLDSPK